MTRSLTLAAAGVLTALSSPALAEGLRLTIDGIRNGQGNILITVFSEAKAYETLNFWQAEAFAAIPARPGSTAHAFPDLTAGPYAVVLFHDENGDEDLNFSGDRLLEGIGVSGARSPDDEPGFAEASVPPGDVTVQVFYDG
ncbi:DUF2141 domain-containing protein [Leisingera aquaemixtae]|uniref:DUF2141 domain-containing protein n=1 Tax=Leisingera aquaemixtae TaxID=1396826 RepID=UPI0021A4D969|nr:DUF2141 domain-containing protein [Leisingera aquaemixtae]UWQ24086.1 DUF2141 domain-containing protein [Leisingera aquaemixtae]